ncbi:MAG: O-antigen ligase family protein [Pleurocapsa sp.]
MVLYPFVCFWQIGLILPVLWLLLLLWQGKVRSLGNGLDWFVGLIVLAIALSTTLAQFPQPAIWQGWSAFCYLAAIYCLNSYLSTEKLRYQVLVRYGYLSVAFIVLSLWLWTTETLLPELNRISALKEKGVNVGFDFSVIELRNWAPIGHQNYVAGYLLLAIPLLVGLSLVEKGKRRWFWLFSVVLGLIDLYSTSSKGGWLALIVVSVVGFGCLLFFSSIPRLWLILSGLLGSGALLLLIVSNNRLFGFIQALSQGKGGNQLIYRQINAVLGWDMGASHPLGGVGLGNVVLLYQKYRPFWAGRESELIFQLHSTPVQLWAEMGVGAIAIMVGAIAFLLLAVVKLLDKRNQFPVTDRILGSSICAGFFGYGILSITDYQLDNVCISGTLVLFVACLAGIFPNKASVAEKPQRYLSLTGSGITVAAIAWLLVVHYAWQQSYQGFRALAAEDTPTFVSKLTQAHRLAPWESYYPYQLAWNLGDSAQQTQDRNQRQQLSQEAIKWFQKAVEVSPYREFGYSNLGWLLLNQNPPEAAQAFSNAAQLVPAKRGVFFGLAWSLLAQQKNDLALEALTLEALRDPLMITSPIWRSQNLQPIYTRLLQKLLNQYNQILEQHPNNSYFRLSRGSLNWWLGNVDAAQEDWNAKAGTIQGLMLQIDSDEQLKQQIAKFTPNSPIKLLIDSWFDPKQRPQLLNQAWLQQMSGEIDPQLLEQFQATMAKSTNFTQWLKYTSPTMPYRRQREGFGVVSRHIDGAIPSDYFLVVENIAIATWFEQLFISPVYNPEVDKILQPRREALFSKIS